MTSMRKNSMEIKNDEWHAVELPHPKDMPKEHIPFKLIPQHNPDNPILISYKALRWLAAIIVEVGRDVESR